MGCRGTGAASLPPLAPWLPTALPCSRVMASTSCSGVPRLLTALCSSLGVVGLGVGMNPPLPHSLPQGCSALELFPEPPCPTASWALPVPHTQPSPPPMCSPRARGAWSGGVGLPEGQGLTAVWAAPGSVGQSWPVGPQAWPGEGEVTGAPGWGAARRCCLPQPGLMSPQCPTQHPLHPRPLQPCVQRCAHQPSPGLCTLLCPPTAMCPSHICAPHLHPCAPSVPLHPPLCLGAHLHLHPQTTPAPDPVPMLPPSIPLPPPYLCPPVLGTAHATGPSSSSRTTSGFLILRPRARAAGWALLAGRGGHAWPRCVTGGCRGGIRHLAGGDGGGLCTRRFHTDTVTAPSTRPGALPSRPASSPPCQPRLQHPATRLGTCSGSPRPRPSPLPIPGGSSSPGTGRNGELRESPPAPARRGPADTVGRQRERGERAAGAGARRGTARTACTARTAHTARSSLCTRTHAAHTVHNPPRHNNPRGRRCPLTRPRSHVSMPPAPPRAT